MLSLRQIPIRSTTRQLVTSYRCFWSQNISRSAVATETATSTPTPSTSTHSKNIVSSCTEGTALNIDVFKGKKPLLALADDAYPEWLWELLDPVKQKERLDADPERRRRKEQSSVNRSRIRMANSLANK